MQDTREARDSSLNKIAGNPNAPERKPRKHPRQLTPVEKRSLEASVSIATETLEQIAFQHTVLCQTCMPYRNPGDEIRVWEREQGDIALLIEAGVARHPETNRWVKLGLPFGPKARLILAHLNAEALRSGSPKIEVERSLTAFVRRLQDPTKRGKSGPNGYQIRAFKDQLGRLSTALLRIATINDNHPFQIDEKVVSGFDLWFPKDEQQRVLWPSTIQLSLDYFVSLQKHAVPLDERALAALSHSAMALDIYTWLAQRLHRIPRGKSQPIRWAAIKGQFGGEFKRMNDFKETFRLALCQVLLCYPKAKIEANHGGLTLRNSPPPVSARMILV